jgi:hypothetical protein
MQLYYRLHEHFTDRQTDTLLKSLLTEPMFSVAGIPKLTIDTIHGCYKLVHIHMTCNPKMQLCICTWDCPQTHETSLLKFIVLTIRGALYRFGSASVCNSQST